MGIRVALAVGAMTALVGIAGCGAAGPSGAFGANAALGLNGPYGLGGPFEGSGGAGAENVADAAGTAGTLLGGTSTAGVTGTAGPTNSTGGNIGVTVRVDGSTALEGVTGMPWLFALGPGVNASAPQSVRPGTESPADAVAGFYDAFYTRRFATACAYVAPTQQPGCPVLLRQSSGADSLHNAAIGFVVIKDTEALVTMTGLLCRTASGCVGQHNAHWIFGYSCTFDRLWALTADEGGNPLTVTPLTRVADRWYMDLMPSASAE